MNCSAQNLKLAGIPKPGTVMIGNAKNLSKITLNDRELQFDKNGTFTFGFDRDAEGIYTLMIEYINGDIETKMLKLEMREYKIQRINNLASKYVSPPKSELPRIERESEMMRQARSEIGKIDSALFISGFTIPVKGGRVTGVFGSQRILNGVPKSPHNGYDIAAPMGTPIFAMADGIVRIAGDDFYYNGNFVLLDHGQGLSSVYIHMSKKVVKDGQFVKGGEKIGEIGSTGRATGDHLHWGVQWFDERIDPISLLELK
ncbi:M23 family metallopeptidase [Bacteroidota bacterium]